MLRLVPTVLVLSRNTRLSWNGGPREPKRPWATRGILRLLEAMLFFVSIEHFPMLDEFGNTVKRSCQHQKWTDMVTTDASACLYMETRFHIKASQTIAWTASCWCTCCFRDFLYYEVNRWSRLVVASTLFGLPFCFFKCISQSSARLMHIFCTDSEVKKWSDHFLDVPHLPFCEVLLLLYIQYQFWHTIVWEALV